MREAAAKTERGVRPSNVVVDGPVSDLSVIEVEELVSARSSPRI
jgi:hypothetical protein